MKPTRRAVTDLNRIYHAEKHVITTAMQLSNACIRSTNLQSQLGYLTKCKHTNTFPPSISNIKFPHIPISHLIGRPLQDLHPESYSARVKLHEKMNKKTKEFKMASLNAYISDKHFRLRETNSVIHSLRRKLQDTCPWYIQDEIHCIIRYWCDFQRFIDSQKHTKKIADQSLVEAEHAETSEVKQKSGLVNLVEGVSTKGCEDLLRKGRNYKLTPTNKDTLLQDVEIGINRLICGLKYANPLQYSQSVAAQQTPLPPHPLKQITSRFDRVLMPPPDATPPIEAKISKLKESLPSIKSAVKNAAIIGNHSTNEVKAITTLKKTEGLGLYLSDKTNNIIVAERKMVSEKAYDHLNGPKFQKLTEDPSRSIELECEITLGRIEQDPELNIPSWIFKQLYPDAATEAPTLQPLLKDHKPDFPDTKIRPVQPVTGSAIEKMDVLVGKILIQLQPFLKYRIRSSQDARDKIEALNETLTRDSEYVIASLDISNMYPNIPTGRDALKVARTYLTQHKDKINLFGFKVDHVMWMLGTVLSNTYISYDGQYYQQRVGVGTGLHSSGSYADILVDDIYTRAIEESDSKPLLDSNYADDALVIFDNRKSFDYFKDKINSYWPTLEFEEEVDEGPGIAFLDMMISRDTKTGKLKYEFYQKATNSGKYLHWDSHCSTSTKINIIRSEATRVMKCCSYETDAWSHLDSIQNNFLDSGYPPEVVKSNLLHGVKSAREHGTDKSQKPDAQSLSHVLKIPYVDEGFTRLVRKSLADSGLDAVRLVTTPGRSVRNLIQPTPNRTCHSDDCDLCSNDIPCRTKHHVYSLKCKLCPESEEEQLYIGGSRRQPLNRLKEHEASARRYNKRTTVGQHMSKHHSSLKPDKIARKVNISAFFENFEAKIEARGKDTLDTFIKEGLLIRDRKPKLNNMTGNGFVFV